MAAKTHVIVMHPTFPEKDVLADCARILRRGGLVIFPTETVYGIAADRDNPDAMARLRAVKRRTDGKPFSVLVPHQDLIANYTATTETAVYKLIARYWPGPLTVVVPALVAGHTIGVRMPDHAVALRLLEEFQGTVAAPSANVEGHPEPRTCSEALRDLDGLVDVALDGGVASIGKGSSVVDCTIAQPKVIRQGVLTQRDIDAVVSKKHVLFVCTGNSCRSVMAEYVLKQYMAARSDLEISSVGTSVFVQGGASSNTLAVLREEGIDARLHQSQSMTALALKKADLIFAMTQAHRQQIVSMVPSVEKKVYLLREFCSAGTMQDIPDPMGQDYRSYQDCVAIIKEAIHKIEPLL